MLGGRICRWLLLFQEYDFEIIVKPGKLNAGFDHLSRIDSGEEPSNLEDNLLDAQLFSIQIIDEYYVDFVGPINPPGKRTSAKYIITGTEYLTRWVEAKAVRNCDAATTAQFIFENIISRFGCLVILMSDQGTHFLNRTIEALTEEF